MIIHTAEKFSQVQDSFGENREALGDRKAIVVTGCVHGFNGQWDCWCSTGLDSHGNQVEPGFVHCAGERANGRQVLHYVDGARRVDRTKVPQADSGVGNNWWNIKVLRDLKERNRNAWRQSL